MLKCESGDECKKTQCGVSGALLATPLRDSWSAALGSVGAPLVFVGTLEWCLSDLGKLWVALRIPLGALGPSGKWAPLWRSKGFSGSCDNTSSPIVSLYLCYLTSDFEALVHWWY